MEATERIVKLLESEGGICTDVDLVGDAATAALVHWQRQAEQTRAFRSTANTRTSGVSAVRKTICVCRVYGLVLSTLGQPKGRPEAV